MKYNIIQQVILPYEKFLQFDWLRAVVFQLNLKYLHVKITNLLRAVVSLVVFMPNITANHAITYTNRTCNFKSAERVYVVQGRFEITSPLTHEL